MTEQQKIIPRVSVFDGNPEYLEEFCRHLFLNNIDYNESSDFRKFKLNLCNHGNDFDSIIIGEKNRGLRDNPEEIIPSVRENFPYALLIGMTSHTLREFSDVDFTFHKLIDSDYDILADKIRNHTIENRGKFAVARGIAQKYDGLLRTNKLPQENSFCDFHIVCSEDRECLCSASSCPEGSCNLYGRIVRMREVIAGEK